MINLKKNDAVAESIKQIMEKELSAKQKKIAKMAGDPEKIDAQDLAALRAGKKPTSEETVEENAFDYKSPRQPEPNGGSGMKKGTRYGGSKQKDKPEHDEDKMKKEEIEQIDELSKSTLGSYAKKATQDARLRFAQGKDFERISKSSRKPEYKAGAKEWEDKYKSDARKREAGVHKAIDRLAKEEVEQHVRLSMTLKKMKEEYEEPILDELINEVLGKDATAGDFIHDFVHSDNPKFAGKSKAERKKMALGAYYAKQRNEEVMSEAKGPTSQMDQTFVTDSENKPLNNAKELAAKTMKKMKTEMLGKAGGTSE